MDSRTNWIYEIESNIVFDIKITAFPNMKITKNRKKFKNCLRAEIVKDIFSYEQEQSSRVWLIIKFSRREHKKANTWKNKIKYSTAYIIWRFGMSWNGYNGRKRPLPNLRTSSSIRDVRNLWVFVVSISERENQFLSVYVWKAQFSTGNLNI